MHLFMKVSPENRDLYVEHSSYHEGDSGLDLFITEDQVIPAKSLGTPINLDVKCAAYSKKFETAVCQEITWPWKPCARTHTHTHACVKPNTPWPTTIEPIITPSLPYFLVPRSSISKTPLRMSNSIGVIDRGYRGSLIAMVDNHSDQDYVVKRGQRYFQLISPTMEPITFELADKLIETSRGSGGFGSTGN